MEIYKQPSSKTRNMACKVQGIGQEQQCTPLLGSDQKLLYQNSSVGMQNAFVWP
jgi:hypothetical protein